MIVAAWLFTAGGVLLAGIGVFFLFVRPPLLPEDLRFLGRSSNEIDELVPQLKTWLRRVFTVLGVESARWWRSVFCGLPHA